MILTCVYQGIFLKEKKLLFKHITKHNMFPALLEANVSLSSIKIFNDIFNTVLSSGYILILLSIEYILAI